ncbi:nucleotide disphospho-sugar-binding domain-containing protein [Allokutzneria oryzae]|uniref:Nucleotide disphospho-sugar-binding domain-containing protein n=1 Tax=Allokutzneria oryzae TaxID=1378989 RepID=A0ABV6A6B1_9PSEU
MRVMFAASAGADQVLPLVSTAVALRAAGHEVLVAAAGHGRDGGPAVLAACGLPAVDLAPEADLGAVVRRLRSDPLLRHVTTSARIPADLDPLCRVRAELAEVMAPAAVRVAERFAPDLVVCTAAQGAGPLAAAVVGVPWVEHGVNLTDSVNTSRLVVSAMNASPQHYGVRALAPPSAVLSVVPPSMGGIGGWPMRPVPNDGGGLLPEWLLEPPSRPRIAVAVGTALPALSGLGEVGRLLVAAERLDVELVLVMPGDEANMMGGLPGNVRVGGATPLSLLLRASSAVVHHGGAASALAALDAGLPQLVLPRGADHFVSAEVLRRRGVALVAEPANVDADLLERLIADRALAVNATAVCGELRALPTPSEIATRLVSLAGSPKLSEAAS